MRNSVDLRVLADIVKNHMGDIMDRTIYPERKIIESVRRPYTMDNNIRPEIVAILMCMIDTGYDDVDCTSAETLYPHVKLMSEKITERKVLTSRSGLVKHAKFMTQSIEINTLGWHRQIKIAAAKTGRVTLPASISRQIMLFAETIVRATQIYDETLTRNRILWDQDDVDYVVNAANANFNWAFDMSYIELAIIDLARPE